MITLAEAADAGDWWENLTWPQVVLIVFVVGCVMFLGWLWIRGDL